MKYCSHQMSCCRWLCLGLLLLSGCVQIDTTENGASELVDRSMIALHKRMAAGEWEGAHGEVLHLLASFPEYAPGYLDLGIISEHLDRRDDAREAYQTALTLTPGSISTLNRLALLSRRQGEFSTAEQYYLRALDVNDHHTATHRNLGILYDLYLGNVASAIKHYEICLENMSVDDPQLNVWVTDLRRRQSQQNVTRADR
jgi:tetratricopeptide (TPR) repeat protein